MRAVERQIQVAEQQSSKELPNIQKPMGMPETFSDYARLMLDLQVLAFQADMTRVSTFMLGHEMGGRAYPELGFCDPHHSLTHHQGDKAKIAKGSVDAARALIEHGANVNVKESRGGQTALMWAVANKYPEIVKLLVEHGADVRARSKGDFTPLLFAAQQGDVESGRTLLEAGSDVNETRKTDRMTALMVAAASSNNEFSVLLLGKGANPGLTDESGYTALHYAASAEKRDDKRVASVKALLAYGANPNLRTTKDTRANTTQGVSLKGATPLFLAASLGNVETARA